MSIAATTVDIIPPDGYTSTNLQDLAYELGGSIDYAKNAAGSAEYKADQVQNAFNGLQGTVNGYIAPLAGKLDAEMSQIFTALNLVRS